MEPIQILLVEDNLADVGLIREGLASFSRPVELHLCRDGAEALSFLNRGPTYEEAPRPDLILLDLNIPRKDGRDVLAVIKADTDLLTIPVVVLSTSSAEIDVEDCYRMHANAYVVKPLILDEFIDALGAIERFWFDCATLHGPPGRAESLRRKRHAREGTGERTVPHLESASAREVAANGGNGRLPDVIVVEDDPAGVEMLEYALTNAGYSTACFRDGATALAALLEFPSGPHRPVVLLDVDLPGIDGFKILREISAARPDAYQVILCTIHKSEASQVLGFKSGAIDYLVKPLRYPVVMAKVRRLLNA